MNAFFEWVARTAYPYPNGPMDTPAVMLMGISALMAILVLAGLGWCVWALINTAFLPLVRRNGHVIDHAYTPAESGTRMETQISNPLNAGRGIQMGAMTMVPVPYNNPERHSVELEVEREQVWLSVSKRNYHLLKKGDLVQVLGVEGRLSKRFHARALDLED